MNKEELLIKIEVLKAVLNDIQKKIDSLEIELNEANNNQGENHSIIYDENTKPGFYSYLTMIKKLNNHTADNYFGHLRGIKKRLVKYNGFKIDIEIYEISDKNTLLEIQHQMNKCEKLKKDNKTQHNAFSAAFNNYLTYISDYYHQGNEKLASELIFDD